MPRASAGSCSSRWAAQLLLLLLTLLLQGFGGPAKPRRAPACAQHQTKRLTRRASLVSPLPLLAACLIPAACCPPPLPSPAACLLPGAGRGAHAILPHGRRPRRAALLDPGVHCIRGDARHGGAHHPRPVAGGNRGPGGWCGAAGCMRWEGGVRSGVGWGGVGWGGVGISPGG